MRGSLTLLIHTYQYCGAWCRGTTSPALHSLTSHAIINHPESLNTRLLHTGYNSSNRNVHVLIGGRNEANHCWSAPQQKRLIPTTYTGTHKNAELDAYIESSELGLQINNQYWGASQHSFVNWTVC